MATLEELLPVDPVPIVVPLTVIFELKVLAPDIDWVEDKSTKF